MKLILNFCLTQTLCNSVINSVPSVVKKIAFLIGLLFLSFNAESRHNVLSKIKESAPETIFLRKVESAVRTHDADLLLTFMLPDYTRTQHDEFLAGNTVQFLNEFFCSTIPFNEITAVSLVEYSLINKSKTDYQVIFSIKNTTHDYLIALFS